MFSKKFLFLSLLLGSVFIFGISPGFVEATHQGFWCVENIWNGPGCANGGSIDFSCSGSDDDRACFPDISGFWIDKDCIECPSGFMCGHVNEVCVDVAPPTVTFTCSGGCPASVAKDTLINVSMSEADNSGLLKFGKFVLLENGVVVYTCDVGVPAGGACNLGLNVGPAGEKKYKARAEDQAGNIGESSPVVTINVTGPQTFTATPSPIDFGPVNIGSSKKVNLALTGTGGITLNSMPTITAATPAIAAQFSHNWPFSIPNGLNETPKNFWVTFTPQGPAETKSAELNFDTSAGPKTVNLQGDAAAAGCGAALSACSTNAQCCSNACDIGASKCAGRVSFIGQVGGPCGAFCSGPAPLVVTFVDDPAVQGVFAEDVLGAQNWSWDIPGGATLNPTNGGDLPISPIIVTYSTQGAYNATLNLFGAYENFKERVGYISVTGAATSPTANFTFSPAPPTPVNVGDTVNFTDFSTPFNANPENAIVARIWDFDDGTVLSCPPNPMANCINPSHQFTNPGLHNIILLITDEGSIIDGLVSPTSESNSITKQINVQGGPPITGLIVINKMNPADTDGAAITTSPNVRLDFACTISGVACDAGDEMRFSNLQANLSTAPVQVFTASIDPWDITPPTGDGVKAVYVQFKDGGPSAWSAAFADTITLSTNGPTACFDVTVNNFQVNFNSSSCSTPGASPPITLWEWNFGDGVTLSGDTPIEQNPPHGYSPPKGNRTATLVITDNLGVKSLPFSKTFFVGPPTLDFTLGFPNILDADTTGELIDAIINLLAWIIIPLAVLLVIYAAFRYAIAGAIPAERAKAIQIIQYALIGIVVVVLAKVIKGLIELLFI